MITETSTNRYATDWNAYSAAWDQQYAGRYRHLGDEWCDDGTADRAHERRVMGLVEPWLRPGTRALEIGPGGGKWTVRLAPRVHSLLVFDVADAMLDRTRARCQAEGLENAAFVLGDGSGLTGVADASLDLVFSYDVFVHIALEDTVAYVDELARVLAPGGVAIIHHAVAETAASWDRIESHNDWYRDRNHTLGQYYYHSREGLRRAYERAGFEMVETWDSYCTSVFTVRKRADSVVPRLERALRQAAVATTPEALRAAADAFVSALDDARGQLAPLVASLDGTTPGLKRYAILQRMRRLVRG
ncbi:MAG: class I SAM-dependent methyltransferase [Vicinamibacterales bacterium]